MLLFLGSPFYLTQPEQKGDCTTFLTNLFLRLSALVVKKEIPSASLSLLSSHHA